MSSTLPPNAPTPANNTPPLIACIGAGQLGRMLAAAAAPLGARLRVLDPAAHPPAAAVAHHIRAPFDDRDALARLADGAHALTFEFESIPERALEHLERVCPGLPIRPSRASLAAASHRLREKRLFDHLGIPTPAFRPVRDEPSLRAAAEQLGTPLIIKTTTGGYDGKGQWRIHDADDLPKLWRDIAPNADTHHPQHPDDAPLIAERFVPFQRELSITLTRGRDGAITAHPVPANRHAGGILRASVAPAPGLTRDLNDAALDAAARLADHLDHVGTLCLELFEHDGALLANEFAPRVHNSAHWTIDACVTSQFQNHARAVLGLPPGNPAFRPGITAAATLNLIGSHPPLPHLLALEHTLPPNVTLHTHLYAKAPKPGRKLGHLNINADTPAALADALERIEPAIETAHTPAHR